MSIQELLKDLKNQRRWATATSATLILLLIHLYANQILPFSLAITVFSSFLVWVVLTIGWGKILITAVGGGLPSWKARLPLYLSMGLAAQCLVNFILSALGISQYGTIGVAVLGFIGAFYALPSSPSHKIQIKPLQRPSLGQVPSFILTSFISLRIWQALSPDMHPDALWYHLTAPLDWFRTGGFSFNPDAIQLMQSSYWESLYLWPFNLFGIDSIEALLASHIFAQLVTISAWICTGFLGSLLLKEIIPGLPHNLAPCVTIAILTTAELSLSLPTPKNDWGVALFFILSALYLIKSNPVGIGLMGGLCFGAKFSYLVPAAALVIISFNHLMGLKRRALVVIVFILSAGPVLIRNYALTKNPLFPVLGGVFGNENIPIIWREALAAFSGAGINLNPQHWQKIMLGAFPSTQLLTLLLLLPAAIKIYNSYWGRRFGLWVVGSMVIFGLVSGDRAELRLIGVVSAIVSGASIYALYILKDAPVFRIISKEIWGVIASLYLILGSETPWGEIFKLNIREPLKKVEAIIPLEFVESLPIDENNRVLLAYETRLYYFFNKGAVRIWDSLNISPHWQGSVEDAVNGAQSASFRYLLVSSTVIDNFLRTEVVSAVVNSAKMHPSAIIFQDKDTLIIDLFLLKSHLMRKEGPTS